MLLPLHDDPKLIDAAAQMTCRWAVQLVPLPLQDLQQSARITPDPLALASEVITNLTSAVRVLEEHEHVPGIIIIHHI